MSSARNIGISTPPSDAALRAFCSGTICDKLLGATMDADLSDDLRELDVAMSMVDGPEPPERELTDPTQEEVIEMGMEATLACWKPYPSLYKPRLIKLLKEKKIPSHLATFPPLTSECTIMSEADAALRAFRTLYPRCEFQLRCSEILHIVRRKPDGERRLYLTILVAMQGDGINWVKGCTMAYMCRRVLTGKLGMPGDEAPQCLILLVP